MTRFPPLAHFGADDADRLGHSPFTTKLTEPSSTSPAFRQRDRTLARSPLFRA